MKSPSIFGAEIVVPSRSIVELPSWIIWPAKSGERTKLLWVQWRGVESSFVLSLDFVCQIIHDGSSTIKHDGMMISAQKIEGLFTVKDDTCCSWFITALWEQNTTVKLCVAVTFCYTVVTLAFGYQTSLWIHLFQYGAIEKMVLNYNNYYPPQTTMDKGFFLPASCTMIVFIPRWRNFLPATMSRSNVVTFFLPKKIFS